MSRVKWSNQFVELPSQSAFHNKVRGILANDSFFKHLRCYQEVNVRDLIPTYEYTNHHYDWYIEELRCVIELHGKQHYTATNFGGLSWQETQNQFQRMQYRDSIKKEAALGAGFTYVEIPYNHFSNLKAENFKNIIFP
jgi:hypothetical protein